MCGAEPRETLSQNKVKGKEGRRKEGSKHACNLGVGLSGASETVDSRDSSFVMLNLEWPAACPLPNPLCQVFCTVIDS